ncbi:bifunctional nuclease family protein [Actinotalea sp.]|uniref:bifunctional nuclease family protein n=1 Tax=Actinotalea sp. TaxID=1872145 RepID=UPI003565FE6A
MDTSLVELDVLGVRRQGEQDEVVVLLLDLVGRRLLPIVVGPSEGSAIAVGHAGIQAPRPMTHDLLVAVLAACGGVVTQVEVTELTDGVFHAAVVLDGGSRVDARASDAIALAVRIGCPVMCAPDVLEAASLPVEGETPADEVARFRVFLDTVSPEDFGGDPGEEHDAETGPGEP